MTLPAEKIGAPRVSIEMVREAGAWSESAVAAAERGVVAVLDAEVAEIALLSAFDRLSIELVFADDALLRDLNRDFRGKDRATNVLSFESGLLDGAAGPLPNGVAPSLGEVIIAWETAAREAVDENKSVDDHVCHLAVHGTLHLLGYDHEVETEAEAMEARERELLASLGIADPYATSDGTAQ